MRPAARPIKTDNKSGHAKAVTPPPPVYRNPVRDIHGLLPERVDMGADFGGTGPVYAIGNAVVTNATGNSLGWPGGGWITYQLTSGPAAGRQVYVAEDIRPAVQVGQHVTSRTVVGNMFIGGSGIETGWAMADGSSAESQLPEAGGISGGGPFPTNVGLNFDSMLIALGTPAGFGYTHSGGFGTVPSSYPASWASLHQSREVPQVAVRVRTSTPGNRTATSHQAARPAERQRADSTGRLTAHGSPRERQSR